MLYSGRMVRKVGELRRPGTAIGGGTTGHREATTFLAGLTRLPVIFPVPRCIVSSQSQVIISSRDTSAATFPSL
eukprot:2361173-Prymnesium_polylepis.1